MPHPEVQSRNGPIEPREAGADIVVGSGPVAEDQECRGTGSGGPPRCTEWKGQPVNAPVPLGAPRPDGPSYPVVPVQR